MTLAERADELAGTFRAKSQLLVKGVNQYTELQHEEREEQQGFLRLGVRTLHKILKSLMNIRAPVQIGFPRGS